jgi:5-formyltetrahydrofolate cyclo-ligase
VALPDALFVERLPREAHDVAVDAVMTETQMHRTRDPQ